jgi:uncharacterized protein
VHPADLLLIPLGVIVGAFGTLVGAGGGFVLAPALLLLYPERKPELISSMSLFVVFANSVSGTVAYGLQRRVDWRSAAWFALGTFPGALAGAIVVGYVPRQAFDGLFAVSLGVIGLYLFLRRPGGRILEPVRGRGVTHRELRDREGVRYFYSFHLAKGVAASAAIGFFSSLLGIGGGVIHVPVMVTILHFPVHIAAATSQAVLVFMAGEGTVVHFASGTLEPGRPLTQACFLALGAIPGAQLGARLSRKVRSTVILRALSVALILVAVRLGVKAVAG